MFFTRRTKHVADAVARNFEKSTWVKWKYNNREQILAAVCNNKFLLILFAKKSFYD